MNSFVKEPARLAAERQRLHSELVQASLEHYPVFIKCAQASAQATKDAQACRNLSTHLCKDIDALEKGCTTFAEIGNQWKAGRAQAAHLINNHSKLLELLEVPQLLETCLRNEMYHEALLLHDHIKLLAEANMHIPLVRMIAEEVESTMKHLLTQILGKLSSDLSLAVCMKVVAFLSRLKIMSDKELRVVFLQKRYQYLQSILADAAAHTANISSYMSKVTSVIKIHLFDILTQYQSVFPTQKEGSKDTFDTPVCDVIAAWLLAVFEQYLSELQRCVAMISSGSELRSLLDQCMNCGYTLSRLNIDIRGLVVPIFTNRVIELYNTAADQAYSSFTQAMVGYRWTSTKAQAPRPDPSDSKDPPSKLAPPPVLLQYAPLGHITNGFLTAFNEIRRCSPVSAAHECAAITARVLQMVVDDIVKAHETMLFEASEESKFLAFAKVAAEDFIAYICKCLDTVFDQTQLLDHAQIGSPLINICANAVAAPSVAPSPPPTSPLPVSPVAPSTTSAVVGTPLTASASPIDSGYAPDSTQEPAASQPAEQYSTEQQEGSYEEQQYTAEQNYDYEQYGEGYDYTAEQYGEEGAAYDYGEQADWGEGQENWDQQAWEGQEGWDQGEWHGQDYGDYGEAPVQEAPAPPAPDKAVPSPPKGKKAD